MPNAFVHIEIRTRDISRAADFYGSLFNWKIDPDPGTGYVMIDAGERPAGGLFEAPEGMPLGTTAYVRVADLDTAIRRAEQLGGKKLSDPQEVAGMGWWALISDPEGNVIGLWQHEGPYVQYPE